jgi:hypothetical protein
VLLLLTAPTVSTYATHLYVSLRLTSYQHSFVQAYQR